MNTNKRRSDPYKLFNFRVLFASILAGAAALGIVKKLRGASPPNPVETGQRGRPIESVGTTTAAFVGTAPKAARKTRGAPAGGRRQPRKTKAGTPKSS